MDWLEKIFDKQMDRQYDINGPDCYGGNFKEVYNSATAAMVELGEMLQVDTRWKPFVTKSKKEPIYDEEKFLEEWSDAFIYMLNVLIYYGAGIDDIKRAVENKLAINDKRFENGDKEQSL